MSCGGRKRCVAHRVASSHDGKHISRQSAAETTTDQLGRYELSLPPGAYRMQAGSGQNIRTANLMLEAGQTQTANFVFNSFGFAQT